MNSAARSAARRGLAHGYDLPHELKVTPRVCGPHGAQSRPAQSRPCGPASLVALPTLTISNDSMIQRDSVARIAAPRVVVHGVWISHDSDESMCVFSLVSMDHFLRGCIFLKRNVMNRES